MSSTVSIVLLVLAIGLAAYLLVALIDPERF
ncbi:K(+)-transporting ATPase subunit F [Corynebacterium sp.]|nr:K(+)-transporting ATPase subunit F [Corynebacterium sp.]MDO4609167.1 K(+)-transporting ATPase subunit F [Corynebacterium sp.]